MVTKKHYKQLTQEEKYQIKALYESGKNYVEIGKQLRRSPSTICREIKRGKLRQDGRLVKNYNPKISEKSKERSRKLSGKTRACMTAEQWLYVLDGLRLTWSPEQISGRYNNYESHEKPLSTSSIYRAINRNRHSKYLRKTYLRRGGKSYNKTKKKGGVHLIPNRIDIELRPKEADEKTKIGHWEADTVIGSNASGVLVTLVEKASRFTLIKKISNKTADLSSKAIISLLEPLAKNKQVNTITYDNGGEFAWHEKVNEKLNSKSFFAKPYHSWERGLNEHTNGLIREFLPKKSSFNNIDDKIILNIQNSLNFRPRKCLNYRTPHEALYLPSS